MAYVTNGNSDLVRKNLLRNKDLYNRSVKNPVYMQLAMMVDTTQQLFEIAATNSGLDLPQVRPEMGVAPQSSLYEASRLQIQGQKRMLEFRMSDEAFRNDQYGLARAYGTLLGASFAQAKEIAAAVYLIGAGTSALLADGFGIAAASASHPLEVGTASNVSSSTQTLGIIALEDACSDLQQQSAHKAGILKPCPPPYQLEVGPKKTYLAQRLSNAKQFPTTPDNDPNPAGGDIQRVVTVPYVSSVPASQYYWCVTAMDKSMQGRAMLSRYGLEVNGIEYVPSNDSWKVVAKENYLFYQLDWRGHRYSLATA